MNARHEQEVFVFCRGSTSILGPTQGNKDLISVLKRPGSEADIPPHICTSARTTAVPIILQAMYQSSFDLQPTPWTCLWFVAAVTLFRHKLFNVKLKQSLYRSITLPEGSRKMSLPHL
jgi:hypothetical protein